MADLRRTAVFTTALATAAVTLAACGDDSTDSSGSGAVTVSGSATVNPVTSAVSRDSGIGIDQSSDGTLAGFEIFCSGDSDINNASEAIPGAEENTDYMAMCEDNDVDYVELPVALDTVSLIRHADNDAVDDLTSEELRDIWSPDSDITTWSDVRPEWPDEEIALVGRGEGSGTFDYFTRVVTGTPGEIRDDYEAVDSPTGVNDYIADNPWALGFSGIGNYLEDVDNRDMLSTVSIDGVQPSLENAQDGSYGPLTRPLFIYVSTEALDDNERVGEFVDYYIDNVHDLLPNTYVHRLPEEAYDLVKQRFDNRTTGSLYAGDNSATDGGQNVVELLRG